MRRARELRELAALAPHGLRALARAGVLRPLPPARARRALGASRDYGMGFAASAAVGAIRDPDGIAVIDERGALTFAQLDRRASALAAALQAEHAVGPGGQIAVMCRNHRGLIELLVAAGRLGAGVLLLNTDFPGPQVAQALAPHAPALVACDEEFLAVLDGAGWEGARLLAWRDDGDAPPPPLPTLDALVARGLPAPSAPSAPGRVVILSSGTTGTPKGVARDDPSPLAALGLLTSLLERLGLRAGDPLLVAPPVFHTLGLGFVGLGLLVGQPLVLRRRFDAAATLAAIAAHRVTHVVAVPAMLQRILALDPQERARHDRSSLRAVAAGGAPLAPHLADAFMDAFGEILFNLYGSTEAGLASIATPADLRAAPGTVGRPVRGTSLVVLDEARAPLPAGRVGTLFAGSAMAFDGYVGGGTREVVDGRINVGDLAHFDAAGRLFIDGREDDMIVSGGENVFPQEVEDVLLGHPGLADAAVLGVADADFGQRLRAWVVARDGEGPSEEELTAYLRERLARYKLPRELVFVDEIPRTPTGKVKRLALRGG